MTGQLKVHPIYFNELFKTFSFRDICWHICRLWYMWGLKITEGGVGDKHTYKIRQATEYYQWWVLIDINKTGSTMCMSFVDSPERLFRKEICIDQSATFRSARQKCVFLYRVS